MRQGHRKLRGVAVYRHFVLGGALVFLIGCVGCAVQPAGSGGHRVSIVGATALADTVMPYVYTLIAHDRHGEPVGQGSAFLWERGYLVTNAHLVAGAAWVEVLTERGETRGTIPYALHLDVDKDLAILPWLGQSADGLPLASQRSARGDTVFAFGAPMGLEGSLSSGLISAHRRLDGIDYLQTTAPISRGSSGGPLVDEQGRVVGIITAFFQEGQNLNLAVPADVLSSLDINRAVRLPFPPGMSGSSTTAAQPGGENDDIEEAFEMLLRFAVAETLQPSVLLRGQMDDPGLEIFKFEGRQGEYVTLEARSRDFDPVLIVIEGASLSMEVPWELTDDDGGRGTDSRIDFKVPRSGTYYVLLSAIDGRAGEYQIGYLSRALPLDARWHWIASSEGEEFYFLDLRSILGAEFARRAWVLMEYSEPRYTAQGNQRYSSARALWAVRCDTRHISLSEITMLERGRVVRNDTVPDWRADWLNVGPGTIGESILKAICR